MPTNDTLVSIRLPVRNGAEFIEGAVTSILAQDHGDLELVISDNASDDATEEICREFARGDPRVRYHRQHENIGLLNNFIGVQALASGKFFKWVGDDDWLAPAYLTRCLESFAEDQRLILVATQQAYVSPDGRSLTSGYTEEHLRSDLPVERFAEMLRLLNESYLLIDPIYGVMRRELAASIPRRNMLREDETFAAKLALMGPFGYVPEILSYRRTRPFTRLPQIARRLGVPAWHARVATVLQCRELLAYVREAALSPEERRLARVAVTRLYARRHMRTTLARGRKLRALVAARTGRASPPPLR